jgi:tRNA A22 N-methylase
VEVVIAVVGAATIAKIMMFIVKELATTEDAQIRPVMTMPILRKKKSKNAVTSVGPIIINVWVTGGKES